MYALSSLAFGGLVFLLPSVCGTAAIVEVVVRRVVVVGFLVVVVVIGVVVGWDHQVWEVLWVVAAGFQLGQVVEVWWWLWLPWSAAPIIDPGIINGRNVLLVNNPTSSYKWMKLWSLFCDPILDTGYLVGLKYCHKACRFPHDLKGTLILPQTHMTPEKTEMLVLDWIELKNLLCYHLSILYMIWKIRVTVHFKQFTRERLIEGFLV